MNMTENEEKAIKWIKNVRDVAVVTLDHIQKNEPNVNPMLYAGRKQKAETIITSFEELEAYRAIGTVEEVKELKEKAEPKEPIKIKTDEKILYMCPSCRKIFIEAYDTVQRGHIPKFCEMCGQDIKRSLGQ